MKKFLLHLLAFLLPIVLLAGMLEASLRWIPNDYKVKKAYLDHNANEIQTLILGNSHTFYGIDPSFLTANSFNAANVSQPLELDYLILKKYEDQWANLKTIIIPVDYFTLFLNLDEGGEGWRVKNYNLYFGLNASDDLATHTEVLGTNLKLNLRRFRSYYVMKEEVITSERQGWGNAYRHNLNPNLQETGKSGQSRHTVKSFHLLNENIRILTSIIEFAKLRDINVVLITSPAYKSYYEGLNEQQINTTVAEVTKLKNAHGITYHNMLRDDSFQDTDFYDADHLNAKGAEKLSLKIDSLLKVL